MTANILERLLEHNNWANGRIIEACMALNDEQLDAEPRSVTKGNIRSTLVHLATAQQGYLRLLTVPLEERLQPVPEPLFAELEKSVAGSGEGLLRAAGDEKRILEMNRIQTRDGYLVEPWALFVEVIDHATEHREQIKSMLNALGVTPPSVDGWDYAEWLGAMVPVENKAQQDP